MEGFKEFQGKSLDDAIKEACKYFDADREKLEIEILNDAKSGIFGLVGARKARVRARRMLFDQAGTGRLRATGAAGGQGQAKARQADSGKKERNGRKPQTAQPRVSGSAKDDSDVPEQEKQACSAVGEQAEKLRGAQGSKDGGPKKGHAAGGSKARKGPSDDISCQEGCKDSSAAGSDVARAKAGQPAHDVAQEGGQEAAEKSGRQSARRRPRRKPEEGHRRERDAGKPAPREDREARPAVQEEAGPLQDEDFADAPVREVDLATFDQERLVSVVQETVAKLVLPILDDATQTVRVEANRIKVFVDCGDNSGLLIGREGQTLASIQYLVNRIVAKELGAPLRIQLDAGDYRERQDEKLRELALYLADRAKTLGKPQSTRPLSSYHRRIVHLALQADTDIQTRSKGEGSMKRVVILRKRKA